jgi:CheY-like chemotaxis protein
MKKILLVEDDNNLREIYGARLLAEGYDIVSAKDGEEALSMAVGEKPDLIISDIMMPKISGFDMLDILRATPQTKDTKVIMMTALSQAEDRERGERLGADRYLVKSQVTLEDVVKVVSDVIGAPAPAAPAAPVAATPVPAPTTTPAAASAPAAAPAPAPEPPVATTPPTPAPVAEPAAPAPAPVVATTPPTPAPAPEPPVATTPPTPPTPARRSPPA